MVTIGRKDREIARVARLISANAALGYRRRVSIGCLQLSQLEAETAADVFYKLQIVARLAMRDKDMYSLTDNARLAYASAMRDCELIARRGGS